MPNLIEITELIQRHRHMQGPSSALTQFQMLTMKLWMALGCWASYLPLEQPKMSLSLSWGSASIPTDFCFFYFFYFLSHLRVTKSSHVQAAGISVLLTQFPESTSTGLMLHFCSCAQVLLPSLATAIPMPEQKIQHCVWVHFVFARL